MISKLAAPAPITVAGSSTGVASPPLARAVSEHVTAARQDRVQTVVNAGTGVGVMVSGPVALLTQEQWRTGWWIFTALAALALVGLVSLLAAGPDDLLRLGAPVALFGVLGLAAVVLVHELAEIVVIANGVRAGRAKPLTAPPATSAPITVPA